MTNNDLKETNKPLLECRKRHSEKSACPTKIDVTIHNILDKISHSQKSYANRRQIAFYLISLSDTSRRFGKLPHSLINLSDYWKLTHQEMKVLNALLFYRNDKTSIASPGYATLLNVLRRWKPSFSSKSLQRAISILKIKGFIFHVSKSCPNHASEYFIATNKKQVEAIKELNFCEWGTV